LESIKIIAAESGLEMTTLAVGRFGTATHFQATAIVTVEWTHGILGLRERRGRLTNKPIQLNRAEAKQHA
jgi:hypothetical protein